MYVYTSDKQSSLAHARAVNFEVKYFTLLLPSRFRRMDILIFCICMPEWSYATHCFYGFNIKLTLLVREGDAYLPPFKSCSANT